SLGQVFLFDGDRPDRMPAEAVQLLPDPFPGILRIVVSQDLTFPSRILGPLDLHARGDQKGLLLRRNDQAKEPFVGIAVETGQVQDVGRRSDQGEINAPFLHPASQLVQFCAHFSTPSTRISYSIYQKSKKQAIPEERAFVHFLT